ncbi:Hsp20/alpha crystallin family protein [Treponema sp. TIM-1]|uniref:Hsp20/alpha crystallin family protein n=1 Tax=Treponema sp. TIM-1 TaxID=2898417 RepID=UPI003980DBE3
MKAVTLYRPLTIEKALNDFDRYMESFFGESPLTPSDRLFNYSPAVDVREVDGSYILEAELPGYDEKDLEIHLDNRTLIIKSKKEEKSEKKEVQQDEGRYYIRERRKTSFSRSFKLPEDADQENITANFKNGLLCLEIKKRAETQKRLITIGK